MEYEAFERAMKTGYRFADELTNLGLSLRMLYEEIAGTVTEADIGSYRTAFWAGFHEGELAERELQIGILTGRINAVRERRS